MDPQGAAQSWVDDLLRRLQSKDACCRMLLTTTMHWLGPRFTSRAFMAWAQTHGIRHILIQPARPMQNGYIDSINGKFRDEQLNESWFETLHQARTSVAIWHTGHNDVRLHSSLDLIPPARFAELHRHRAGDAAQPPFNSKTNRLTLNLDFHF